MTDLCVVFHHLLPSHVARLGAAAAGGDLHVLEIAGQSEVHPWTDTRGPVDFRRTTLFESGSTRDRAAGQIAEEVAAALDRIGPRAVAVMGWWDSGSRGALRWCAMQGVSAVMMSDSRADDLPRSAMKEWVKRRLIGLCGSGFVAGQRSRDYFEKLGMHPELIFAGYDVVDNEHFARGADEARKRSNELRDEMALPRDYFVASGRLVERKNFAFLLEAFAEYRDRAPEDAWDLVLVGDGPLREVLEGLASRLGMSNAVHFEGFVDYERMPRILGLARAFVHTSDVEQWGMVVNEALAAGLPVLVSDRCGCVPELVEPGRNGWVFEPSHPSALAALLLEATRDGGLLSAMGAAGREIVESWGLERFAENLWKATEAARAHPPHPGVIDRLLLAALCRARLRRSFS